MAFTVTLGSVTISINPAAALEPKVVAQPSSTAAVYATFAETILSDGLTKTVFDAFAPVANRNVHANAKIPWPTKYGTTDEPYGSPGSSETGEKSVPLVDIDDVVLAWTGAIHTAAKSRKSFLEHYAELALAVAAGIKAALEGHIRTGRVTVPGAVTPGVPGTLQVAVQGMTGEVFLSRRGPGEVYVSAQSGSGFTISNELIQPIEVSWLVVG